MSEVTKIPFQQEEQPLFYDNHKRFSKNNLSCFQVEYLIPSKRKNITIQSINAVDYSLFEDYISRKEITEYHEEKGMFNRLKQDNSKHFAKFSCLIENWKNIANKHSITWKSSFLQWNLPKNIPFDFSLTLILPIAHKTKKNPREVAREIIESNDYSDWEIDITKQGYINFRFPITYQQEFLRETFQEEGKNLQSEKKNTNINIEYVSANPTGYLHLAHFRHAVIGNTLANVYQFAGYNVVREYYINDRGEQIATLMISVLISYHEQLKGSPPPKQWLDKFKEKEEYSGKSSQEIAQKLINKWGRKYIREEVITNKKEFDILKKEILELILAKIRQDLENCGIEFDKWSSETDLYKNNNDSKLFSELEEKKLIHNNREGAIFFLSSLAGDEKDRVIVKQNGEYTYFFSDILYHRDKLKRADKIINVWGADHHGYISRIKAACQLLDYKAEDIQIVLVQTVSLLTKEGKTKRFSKRLGNTIELEEALQYLAIDQLKFFLLEKEPNQPLSLNIELLKENQEKTRLYYIQYAHARCHQILQKAQEKGLEQISPNIDLLKAESERKICNLLIRFPFVLENILEENKPHHLVHYLYEVARAWQIYYQNNIILDPKNIALTTQKLLLVKDIQLILKLGLELMGVTAPNIM